MFWTSRGLIHNSCSQTELPRLAAPSDRKGWLAKGRLFFHGQQFDQAITCFQKAEAESEIAVTKAYLYRQEARATPRGTISREKSFEKAAQAFLECMEVFPKFELPYSRIAGECYEACGKPMEAAKAYEDAEEFDTAAQIYVDLQMFENARKILVDHRAYLHADSIDRITQDAGIHYIKQGQFRYENIFLPDFS